MQPLRDSFPKEFLRRLQQEVGREESLRLLWPTVVGAQLAANTRPKGLRGGKLVVAVPDRTWRVSLAALETMILEAVNRFWQEDIAEAIEFVEDPQMAVPWEGSRRRRAPTTKASPSENLSAALIADVEVREAFLESARKYFAWQEECRR